MQECHFHSSYVVYIFESIYSQLEANHLLLLLGNSSVVLCSYGIIKLYSTLLKLLKYVSGVTQKMNK